MKLPKNSLMDSVTIDTKIVNYKGFIGRLLCEHTDLTTYTRTDHRAGPGSFADVFEGVVCCDCGKIVQEEQTL
jgi:hypothetical protein